MEAWECITSTAPRLLLPATTRWASSSGSVRSTAAKKLQLVDCSVHCSQECIALLQHLLKFAVLDEAGVRPAGRSLWQTLQHLQRTFHSAQQRRRKLPRVRDQRAAQRTSCRPAMSWRDSYMRLLPLHRHNQACATAAASTCLSHTCLDIY